MEKIFRYLGTKVHRRMILIDNPSRFYQNQNRFKGRGFDKPYFSQEVILDIEVQYLRAGWFQGVPHNILHISWLALVTVAMMAGFDLGKVA